MRIADSNAYRIVAPLVSVQCCGQLLSCVMALACASSMIPRAAAAQGDNPAQDNAASAEMAAKVDGALIEARDVRRELKLAFPNREIAADARDELLARTLEQLISRRLVLRWLAETKQAASDSEIDLAISQLKKRLEQRGGTIDEFLKGQDLDEGQLKHSMAWQIAWSRYLTQQLTDANLEKYFQKHKREFDGTEMRVAHILFAVENPRDEKLVESARAKAARVLEEIRSEKVSFAAAVKQHSSSPSREQEGDIGFIARHAPMPESFSRAAFQLEPNQISDPVTTPFGVHLIQCLEIKPGMKPWTEVRAELEQAVTRYLFSWAADQVRSKARIEYSPSFPHFRPGTETLDRAE